VRTRGGGVLKAGSSRLAIDDLNAGRVGDEVVYPEGSMAYIAMHIRPVPAANGPCMRKALVRPGDPTPILCAQRAFDFAAIAFDVQIEPAEPVL
jgi:hypothetical protein